MIELLLIAVGLSMDAFAVSVCTGLQLNKKTPKHELTCGLYFGIFQALMPLIGYLLGAQFAHSIEAYDHWVAFGLLAFIGIRMILGSLKKTDEDCENESLDKLGPKRMFPLAIATSIDALAVGISFAFLNVQIVPAVLFIGVVTLILSIVGVKVGHTFGAKLQSKAELMGGIILVLIGLNILLEHLGIL